MLVGRLFLNYDDFYRTEVTPAINISAILPGSLRVWRENAAKELELCDRF